MSKVVNYPSKQPDLVAPDVISEITENLIDLRNQPRPRTNAEIKQRIDWYFEFCRQRGMRPGIESLALALGISRATLYNWSQGSGCDSERQEIIQNAKMMLAAMLENLSMSGKLNPATSIFLYKNWLGYRDNISFENISDTNRERQLISRNNETLVIDAEFSPVLPD